MRFPAQFRQRYEPIAPDGFFEALGSGLPKTIRLNRLKTTPESFKRRADKQEWRLKQLPWYEDGFVIDREDRDTPLGHSLDHFAGHLYIQEASSMVPPLALDPKPGETVLDMAAAPGSKTTQMASMMANRGLLVANDASVPRLKALAANIERCGTLNTAVTHMNGVRLGRFVAERFDKVLLDAPCTAEGTAAKNREVFDRWSVAAIGKLSSLQSKLLISAYQALRPGGVLVYSTCTFAPEENELVVDAFLKHHPEASIEPFDLPGLRFSEGLTDWQGRSLDDSLRHSRRIWPGRERMEGFFIARIRKGDHAPGVAPKRRFGDRRYQETDRETAVWLDDRFGLGEGWDRSYAWRAKEAERWLMSPEVGDFDSLPVIRRGLRVARTVTKGYKPTTFFCQLFGRSIKRQVIRLGPEEVRRTLAGEDVPVTADPGYVALSDGEIVFGCGLSQGDRLKNQLAVSRRVLPRSRILRP